MLPHDLLITKLSVYSRLEEGVMFFIYNYLKQRKQNVKLNNNEIFV